MICNDITRHQPAGRFRITVRNVQLVSDTTDTESILDLLYHELILRQRHGKAIDLQEFQTRFPELKSELSDLFQVHELIDGKSNSGVGENASTVASIKNTIGASTPVTAKLPLIPHYQIIREAGCGGMGVVYEARHIPSQRIVALKTIRSGQLATSSEVQRFVREAKMMAKLDHPNIIPVYDVGHIGDQYYYTMPFMRGENLSAQLSQGPMTPCLAASLIATVADAIGAAHQQGIIHRDIKPQNILIDDEGRPRVADFGLAKILMDVSDRSSSTHLIGTPQFFAPEPAAGSTDITGAADIHAIGAVLYQALTGRLPFECESLIGLLLMIVDQDPKPPRSIVPVIPRDLQTICMKCLCKTPLQRYTCADDLSADLRRYLNNEPIKAQAVGPIRNLVALARRRPVVATLITGLVCLLVMMASGGTWAWLAVSTSSRSQIVSKLDLLLAQASRYRQETGRYHETPAPIREAARIIAENPRVSIDLKQRIVGEAIAAQELYDLEIIARWEYPESLNRVDGVPQVFFDEGAICYATASSSSLNVYRLTDNDLLARIDCPGRLQSVAISSEASSIAMICEVEKETRLFVWRPAQGVSRIRTGVPTGVAFAPSGKRLAAAVDGELRVTDLDVLDLNIVDVPEMSVEHVRFAGSDDRLVVWRDMSARIIDLADDRNTWGFRNEVTITDVVFDPQKEAAVAGTRGGPSWVWRSYQPTIPFGFLKDRNGPSDRMLLDPMGDFVITTGEDEICTVWNAWTWERQAKFEVSVRFVSADGRRVSGIHDKAVVLFEVRRPMGSRLIHFPNVAAGATMVIVDPLGDFLVTASHDGVHFWSLDGTRYLGRLNGGAYSIAMSSRGNRLVVRRPDVVECWELSRSNNQIVLQSPSCLENPGYLKWETFAASHDGEYVTFAGSDGSFLWKPGEAHSALEIEGNRVQYAC